MRPTAVVLTLILSTVVVPPARADDLASARGAQVRLTLADDTELVDAQSGAGLRRLPRGSRLLARLQDYDTRALLLELPGGGLTRVERAALRRLEAAHRTAPGHVGRSGLIGAGIGLALGGVLLVGCKDESSIFTCGELAAPVLAFGAVLGGGVGLLAGAASSGTRWREVTDADVPPGRSAAARLGPGIALRLRF